MRKILILLLVFGTLPWLCRPVLADPAAGQSVPALVATQLDGQSFDLSAQRGKVVVVNIWATWCAPCRAEMPALDAVYKKYRSKGLLVIGLNADRAKHRGDVVEVMKDYSYPAAMLADAQANDFGWPSTLPVTYIIDRNGTVQAKLAPDQAPLTEQKLDEALQPLMEK